MHDGTAGDPSEKGEWEPIRDRFRHLPVHMALLRTGEVLAFGGSGNDPRHLRSPHDAELWDPSGGPTRVVDHPLAGDVFCVGQAFLPDGRLLIAGGNARYPGNLLGIPFPPFAGLPHAYAFDPATSTWTRLGDLSRGRWYPTLVALGDGRVVGMAGLTRFFPWVFLRKVEVFSAGTGWRSLRAGRWLPLYPRLHLLPDAEPRIFYAGSYNTHYTFPFSLRAFPTAILHVRERRWERIGPPRESQREEGATVLLPLRPPEYRARVLLLGGGTPGGKVAVDKAEVIDLSEPRPVWRAVPPMKHARYWAYAVLLPDGTVLVLGGRSGARGHDHGPAHPAHGEEISRDPRAVHEAELYDPEANAWTTLAPMDLDRLYHSNALLLPDGRVAVAGSNPPNEYETRIETYRPPYLFRGPRPEIRAAPDRVDYGATFEVEATHLGGDTEVVLMRPSATTHCVDTEQRLVQLPAREEAGRMLAVVPDRRNLLPPGYYMLFVVRDRLPSEARFVRVG